MSRGGVRTVEQEHECARPQEQGLGREAWVVICVQQRHHPHVKFKPAHRAGQSFCLRFNSTLAIPKQTTTGICRLKSSFSEVVALFHVPFYSGILSTEKWEIVEKWKLNEIVGQIEIFGSHYDPLFIVITKHTMLQFPDTSLTTG